MVSTMDMKKGSRTPVKIVGFIHAKNETKRNYVRS